MPTARDFIIIALKEAGVLGVGQTPLPEDINDCFILLNRMMAQWQKRRWLVPNLIDINAIGNSQISNLIGPGQYYNSARPDKIQAAYFKQLNSGNTVTTDVSYMLRPIWSYENYAQIQLKNLTTWPQYYFYDAAFPNGNVFIWPIPDQTYEIHLIVKGPIGFTVELENGVITNTGLGYTNGNYLDIPFISLTGFGSGATADVTVAGGVITTVAIHDPGDGYKINDNLTLDTTLMGGTGINFVYNITEVTDDLDAEFNMPPEYEEAIHYNLCIRITSMYQYPTNITQDALAKVALNTLKVANSQIPTLQMPSSLRRRNGSNFYIFNADQQ
jgi:hypothetical protein